MRGAGSLAACCALAAGMAVAQPGVPGPPWFAGLYERVGRDGTSGGIDDHVRLAPMGENLVLSSCAAPDLPLRFDPYGLRENAMISNTVGPAMLTCLFHNDGYNRPVINCSSDEGARFTLWAVGKDFRTAPLDCGG